MTAQAASADTTNQKERLILLNLSVFLNWRFDVTEKESLTLFLSDGISPPSDMAKLSKIFKIDALISNLFYKHKNISGREPQNTLLQKGYYTLVYNQLR